MKKEVKVKKNKKQILIKIHLENESDILLFKNILDEYLLESKDINTPFYSEIHYLKQHLINPFRKDINK
jgi:hypothetical protein